MAPSDLDLSGTSKTHEFTCTDKSEIELRDLAQKTGINIIDVEKIKKRFEEFDGDGSGLIDYEEFQSVVLKLLRVKDKSFLTEDRMEQPCPHKPW